jgi:hypothetical protein
MKNPYEIRYNRNGVLQTFTVHDPGVPAGMIHPLRAPDANAAFIVRACNSHEAMLEALQELERGIRLWISEGVSDESMEKARAAIAQATGK